MEGYAMHAKVYHRGSEISDEPGLNSERSYRIAAKGIGDCSVVYAAGMTWWRNSRGRGTEFRRRIIGVP